MFCILLRHDIINVNENNIHKLQSSVEIVMIISDINWYELPVVASMMMEGYYYIKTMSYMTSDYQFVTYPGHPWA